MENNFLPKHSSFYDKLSRSLMSIVLIVLILYWARHILVPISFAILFSLLLIKSSNYFERIGLGRGLSSLLATLFFIIAGFFIFYLISSRLMVFRNELPRLADLFLAGFHELEVWITQKFDISNSSIDTFLQNTINNTISNSSSIVVITVGTLSNTLIYLLLIPIFTFLFLNYRGLLLRFFIKVFPEKYSETILTVAQKIQYVIKNYLIGLFIEMILVAAMNCIGFFILGVKYALLLGVIAAVLNVIPYLGIFTACIISLLITSTTNSPFVVVGVAVVLLVVHLIDVNIILLKVVGSKVKINVLATLLAILAGSAIWGIPGMLLSIPFMAILKIIFDSVDELKPWGYLIGEEVRPNQPKTKRGLKK